MKINTFKPALDQGKIKEGEYFLVKYPDGKEALFRLFKTEKGYVMWGPPTTEEVLFRGERGYDNLFTLADSQARKEYANDVFEDVHACSLPEREYKFETYNAFLDAIAEFSKMYDFSDASAPTYALASRCVYSASTSRCVIDGHYCLFCVDSGNVIYYKLYDTCYGTGSISYAVRPEAIPKSTMEFVEEGCDGSKEKPWICLGIQEGDGTPEHSEGTSQEDDTMSTDEEKTLEHSKESTSQKEDIINIDKDRLMSLIQEGHELHERVAYWLAELEECVQNLK